jgi:hypothetical protein
MRRRYKVADTTITEGSLAWAIAETLAGRPCTHRSGHRMDYSPSGLQISGGGNTLPHAGWTRADPPILCPRCGNQLDVYDNGGGAAPWYVNDCDCGEKLPAFYESREKLAAGIASRRTPWHRPDERPEGDKPQYLVVWDSTTGSAPTELGLFWSPRDSFSPRVLAWPKCRHRKSHREGYGCAGETAECRTKEWQLVYAKVRCVPVKRRRHA